METQDKVVCRTPTPGKKPTRIARWKYDLVREVILRAVPPAPKSVAFAELSKLVAGRISKADQKRLGNISWYTTTVKLDLEVKGEIERVPGQSPQELRRSVPRR